ncbi:hypothetical protein NEMIN01_1104 [Nematocida minor]|uniref:uncharacterized protein n=1 Tax=Nematocida minor TaxID=1912983 RepID=UPI0022209436|nr:uncharacterized protein NEMIN01_1104 [Nematocida minor]KAI5190566.1 hypothetical protein NEMIN01_1104 [Nematocida minor]
MNIEKDASEGAEGDESYLEKSNIESSHLSGSPLAYALHEDEDKCERKKVSLGSIISAYFSEEKAEIVRNLLKDIVNKKIHKEEVVECLQRAEIDVHAYNAFILRVISTANRETNKKPYDVKHEEECRTLNLKGALKEQFLLEIKKDMEDSSYITKTQQQYSFFKRTPEDLSSVVSSRPQLISLFSANYNVLCCKIKKILSIKDLHNRLKKGSFEYKLNEKISIETAKCAYTVIIHYIKETIGKCLDIDGNLDRNLLIRTMFGNVRGVYLLYNSYPPVG